MARHGGGRERDTDKERERERTEDTVSAGPSPPPLPGLHLPGAARHPLPRGSGVMAKGVRDHTPVLREPFPVQILCPRDAPYNPPPGLSFPGAPWVLLRT